MTNFLENIIVKTNKLKASNSSQLKPPTHGNQVNVLDWVDFIEVLGKMYKIFDIINISKIFKVQNGATLTSTCVNNECMQDIHAMPSSMGVVCNECMQDIHAMPSSMGVVWSSTIRI